MDSVARAGYEPTMQAGCKGAVIPEHRITGGGGVSLHVLDEGNPTGRPLLFIHGLSASHLIWNKQFESNLKGRFRLVALDLRGHGLSDKPRDVYGDSQLWADDIHAVITKLGLERPIVSGSSYGGIVICDYLRFYSDAGLGGVHFVGAISKLGTDAASAVISPEALGLGAGLFSNDVEESATALQAFVRLFTHAELPLAEFFFLLGFNTIVSPHVRQESFSRTLENDDVLSRLRVPVLITHGAKDDVVLLKAAEQHKALIPHATLSVYPNVGHLTFYEQPDRFNHELRQFVLG